MSVAGTRVPDAASVPAPTRLVDRFGRVVDYVRISVTDRCDFRCVYCMEPDTKFVPRPQVLTLEEIAQVARAFVELGVHKIRLTGGEPLVRRNVVKLMQDIAALPGLRELVLTTNGSQLQRLAGELRAAGVKRLNISLDSLNAERFAKITRGGRLAQVLAGIEAARAVGFERLKINTVILKHRNEDEVVPLVRYAAERGMDISFIEEMPLGVIADHDRAETYYSSDEIRRDLAPHFTLLPTAETTGGPARYFRLVELGTRVGFISPHSHNFCDTCNRVRLTTEGRLLLCLGQEHSMDLRAVLRAHPGEPERVKQAIRDAMALKPLGHEFALSERPILFRHMNATGG
ncbi:MAG TPA: GTP 3',8-cyclase MoaA [Gammaproteobacteria bacterium]|nr:GTP 3',8-cyclase MoaA [Gammaproteobacteria bacterium]